MRIFYEPVNLNQWNMFQIVSGVGHIEPFLATSSMELGDLVLLHVGSQNSKYESGIYAYGTIVKEPYILKDSPQDYCNNKNTVDVRIDSINYNEPIIPHKDCEKYINQFRSVHTISEDNYDVLVKRLNIGTTSKTKELTDEEKEAVKILLSNVARGTYHITYSELSDEMSTHPKAHYGFNKILDHIGMKCGELGLPFLTLMVVSQSSKEPGDGAYCFYERFGIDTKGMTNSQLFDREMAKIRECSNWQKLADELGLDILMPTRGEVVYPDEVKDKVFVEGAVKKVTVNAYERDAVARRKCLEFYGEKNNGRIKCEICGFDFGLTYGEAYKNMIEVHHIKPLFKIKGEYEVNPITDLIPVCPNCHMVLHSKEGESIEDIRRRLEGDEQ